MCGIFAVLGRADVTDCLRRARLITHRGPDERGHYYTNNLLLAHERLSIIDLEGGTQPIQGCGSARVIHNGEIYNYKFIQSNELAGHEFRTHCDSEVIVHLYEKYGVDFCNLLDGVFGFAIGDDKGNFMVARDPIGVKSLFCGKGKDGVMYFASELKCILDVVTDLQQFPPGHYFTPESGFVKYYHPIWDNAEYCTNTIDYKELRNALIQATEKRLISDAPLGVLLSGGLDSSLTSSIAQRCMDKEGIKLHSFAVGVDPQAPDLTAARLVAKFLGTNHHEVIYTLEEGFAAIDKVIWHLESYDPAPIRSGLAMLILTKFISDMGIKVVLSGEGADEVFGGYLYFHDAPDPPSFAKETIRRVQVLYNFDLVRADKVPLGNAVEARVPFLDRHFLDVAMRIDPTWKMGEKYGIEKFVIRKAFEDEEKPWLPKEVLWRQKEQFGDGVGYAWIDHLRDATAKLVSDVDMRNAFQRFPFKTPRDKEAYYYRSIFEKHFGSGEAVKITKVWTPKWQENTDSSARLNKRHIQSTVV